MDYTHSLRVIDAFSIEGKLEARGLNRKMIAYVVFLAVARICYLEYDADLFHEIYTSVPDLDRCIDLAIKDRKVINYSNEITINSTVVAVTYQAKALYLVLKVNHVDRNHCSNESPHYSFEHSGQDWNFFE